MQREDLVEIAKRMLHYAETGTTASHEDGPRRNPISTYTDPVQFELEKRELFGRYPQLVCFSSDIPEPGDYRTHEETGVPIVVVRNQEGRVRAFLNACSHRSSRLVDELEGKLKRGFTCPYHAWSFDLDGRCTRIFKHETVGRVNLADHGLLELPCEEKYGFVYAAPAPDAHFSIDDHLGDLGPELGSFDLGKANLVDNGEWHLKSNWKLALDTFCEGYHFGPLHPNTVGAAALTNCMTYDRYGERGEHHRLGFPNKTITELSRKPESEWGDPFDYFSFVYFLFPNISLLVSKVGMEFFRLFPADAVGEHVTKYSLYYRISLDDDAVRAGAEAHFNAIYTIVTQDDYWVSANVQKNFNTGLQQYTTFGRNEPSLINMHRAFRTLAGLPTVDVPAPESD